MAVAWMEAVGPLLAGADIAELQRTGAGPGGVASCLHAILEGGPPALAVKPEVEQLFCKVVGLVANTKVRTWSGGQWAPPNHFAGCREAS